MTTPRGHQGFPKGKSQRTDEGSGVVTALRELREETGLAHSDVELVSDLVLVEKSVRGNPATGYFVGRCLSGTNPPLVCDPHELASVQWVRIEEALESLRESRKALLQEAVRAVRSSVPTMSRPVSA